MACSMVRNLPVKMSPIYTLKMFVKYQNLKSAVCGTVIKINLIREGAFYILTCVSTPESLPFKHVLTQENYNPEAYANAF